MNQGRYLAAAMNSVLSQDWQDVEYLLVDPGSSDDTAEIIRDFMRKYPAGFFTSRIPIVARQTD